MEHIVAIEVNCGCDRIYEPWLDVLCSCGAKLIEDRVEPITLADLNDIAHAHIEEVEKGYGTRSAVRSEDELVDLPGMWERADLIGGETDT